MTTVDRGSLDREVSFAQRGLLEGYSRIPVEQESSVIWDEAVRRVKAGDQAWMRSNLGEWMGSYFGHNRIFVLDASNAPIHAMEDGVTKPATEAFKDERAAVEPFVHELRRQIGQAASGLDDSTGAIGDIGVQDFVLLDGTPAIVSIKPIIPDTDALTQRPGSEYLHVAVRFLDESFVDEIAERYQLSGARIAPKGTPVPDSSIPLTNRSGETLGYLVWEPYRPGLSLIEKLGPTIAVASIPVAVLLVWLVRHLWRATQRLRFLAFHDSLTALPNRTSFNIRLRSALGEAGRPGGSVAVMMIDLDRFKNINDTLGHPAGDELIRQVGERLREATADAGTLARLGGDEFAVILSHVESASAAETIAERILREMRRPFVLNGEQVISGVSIGTAVAEPEERDASDLLRKADIALYEAKSKGRRRHQVFFPELSEIVLRRRLIEQDLRQALEDGSITAAYQPVFDRDLQKVLGAEAFMRWQHPIHGDLPPDLIISIAEERGLIEPIGERVLQSACRLLNESSLPWVAVNLSSVQLRSEGFAESLLATLQRFDVDPRRLQFEIKEPALLADDAVTTANLDFLRASGATITLEDFGTGYSSLNHLRRYPVDKVKIDRSLVNQLEASPECQAIARALVSVAKSLNKVVAADGIATQQERTLVVAMGCDELQGSALAKPLSTIQLRSQFVDHWPRANDVTAAS
ncbi:MAG TPA: EAL domain-containing protein [Bauldia sp.]|nr:EAL domain-containing protein [Bauldia sp.]